MGVVKEVLQMFKYIAGNVVGHLENKTVSLPPWLAREKEPWEEILEAAGF